MNRSFHLMVSADQERLAERLLANSIPEPNSGCWLWTGRVNDGYGMMSVGRDTPALAHRVSFHVFVERLTGDSFVCHHCDNRACINQEHLFLGTNVDNMNDMVAKGRSRKGSRHYAAKLSDALALEARRLALAGLSQRAIAAVIGVSQTSISAVLLGRRWANV